MKQFWGRRRRILQSLCGEREVAEAKLGEDGEKGIDKKFWGGGEIAVSSGRKFTKKKRIEGGK